jgi:hypothetical protein
MGQEPLHQHESVELGLPSGSNNQSMDSTIDATPAARGEGSVHWQAGDFVGRYRLDRFVGRGGFGEVWKALDPELNRTVAIKLPRVDVPTGHDVTLRFRDEARRAASLNNDGIVPVFDVGHVAAGTFIVSEYIDGPTLSRRMKAGAIPRDEGVRMIIRLAQSLHQAHLVGLVHRDIKPSNVLLRPDGTPAITDFGLAISEEEQLTAEDAVVGTVAYMSPEQARGEGRLVDGRSDLYSLGIIFYQLLTGRLPFQFRTSRDCLDQIARREMRPPRSIDDTIPPELERICLRCLEKEVGRRYSTGLDLAEDLQNWVASRRPVSRRRTAAIAAVAVVLLAALGVFAFNSRNKPADVPARGGIPAAPPEPAGGRLELFGQPLEEIAALKGDVTDFWQVDEDNRVLTLRSDRNLWILGTRHRGRPPLRIRGSVFVDERGGAVGFCWGLSNDPDAFPKKDPQCFAILVERNDADESVKLSLNQLFVGEFLQGARWINHTAVIAEACVEEPGNPFRALEVVVNESGVELRIDGRVAWKPKFPDPKILQEVVSAEGATGVCGRGKTVIVRDATVIFQTSNRKADR